MTTPTEPNTWLSFTALYPPLKTTEHLSLKKNRHKSSFELFHRLSLLWVKRPRVCTCRSSEWWKTFRAIFLAIKINEATPFVLLHQALLLEQFLLYQEEFRIIITPSVISAVKKDTTLVIFGIFLGMKKAKVVEIVVVVLEEAEVEAAEEVVAAVVKILMNRR